MIKHVVCLVAGGFLLASCGGSMSPPVAGAGGTVEGYVMLGPLAGATVTAYGSGPGAGEIAQTTTTSEGYYRLDVQAPAGSLWLVATGGHYVEESSGMTVYLTGSEQLETVIPYQPGATVNAAITPLTDLAAGLAQYWSHDGVVTAASAAAADREISNVVGFDVVATSPLAVNDTANQSASLSAGLEYGFMLAGFSELAEQIGAAASAANGNPYVPNEAPFDTIDLAQKMADDIRADGLLDGVAGATPVALGPVALDTRIYRHRLAADILDIAATQGESALGIPYGNETGLTVAEVLPFATAYNNSVDPVFGGAPTVSLTAGPRVMPAAGQAPWVRGVITLSGTVQDALTFGPPVVAISIDGNAAFTPALTPVTPLSSTYTFSQTVDTTKYLPDGMHRITESVTDIAGNTGTGTVMLGFDNTPPSGCIQSYGLFNSGYSGSFSGLWSDGSGSGVVSGHMNGVPVSIGSGTWTVSAAAVMATVPGFNMYTNVLPVILTLVDAAGNSFSFNIFPEPQWSNGGPNPALCAP
ncbi:MAG: hypothetical protein ACYCQK_08030 [Acidiferrobacteraceae bacterium]